MLLLLLLLLFATMPKTKWFGNIIKSCLTSIDPSQLSSHDHLEPFPHVTLNPSLSYYVALDLSSSLHVEVDGGS